jgi:hypothetical protein
MTPRWLYREVHGRKPARPTPTAQHQGGPARSSRYRAWVRSLPCAACGTMEGVEAAHTGSDGGAAQKASDYSCIPLCSDCHQFAAGAYHRDRACCEQRIVEFNGVTIIELVESLNRTWKGKEEAA